MDLTVVILLALFGIKHFIADFLLQFPYMISQKGTYGAEGGIHHAGMHGLLTVVLLLIVGADPNCAIELGSVDSLLHYHIDWAKQQLNKGLSAADRMFWIWLGADQGLHYLTYIGISYAYIFSQT
jgi:hypothetical protein